MRWILLITIGLTSLSAHAIELDERPAEPGDWGFRPAENSTPDHNPPAFSWRPVKGAASYVVQVARDPGFERLVYEASDLPWSAHCPPTVFEPGAYLWRYAAKDAEGNQTAWSQARRFDVSVMAPHVPQPTVADLVARMPKDHPRLFFRPEEVPQLRELANGPLAKRWRSVVAQADKLLASPPDLTEPPKYREGVTRADAEWKQTWWGNRQRMIQVVDGAATLAFVYRIGGDEKYGQAARDLLMGLAQWDPNGSTSLPYNDEAGMPALYMASRAYDWAWPVFSDEDRATFVAMMRIRGQQAFDDLYEYGQLWRPYNSHNNRIWHYLGELAIAFHGEIPEAEKWLDYAMTICYAAYPVWGDADGGWHEGAAYWLSYTTRFTWWIEVMRSAFGIDVFDRPFYQRTGYFPMYVLPPGTKAGAFGDQAELTSAERMGDLVAVLAAGARNPYWQWYAQQTGGDVGSGYLGFLFARRAQDLPAKAPDDLPSSICFRGTGVAVLNSNLLDGRNNVQVHFKSCPTSGTQSHGFNVNNSFLVHLNGERAFIWTGRRDVHSSAHHQKWIWDSKSQNAILVNGKGQRKHSFQSLGKITAFAASPTVDVVEGETWDEDSGLKRWRRRIVFFKPGAILIHDLLDAAEPSTFQWLLHAVGPFELGEDAATWTGKPGTLHVRWLEPEGLALTQTDRFDPPPAEWTGWDLDHWHLTADCSEKAAYREFVTLITVGDVEVEPTVEKKGDAVTSVSLALPEGSARLVSTPEGFEVEGPDFQQQFP